ncbi:hypothetical protein AGMMS49944_06730 [Spirochaetia bacterium]|nr:hypothetical protein AGMMS49944_06730 [Spirochaetia bacterium]
MAVPCFPSSGRINVGGYLLVHGVPLHKTEAALDPKAPVHTPLSAEVFRAQTKYTTDSLLIEDLMQGSSFIAEKIKTLAGRGVRIIVFDAISDEDIELIAGAVIASGVKFIAVDPGPFTAALARKLIPPPPVEQKSGSKILVAVGSVNAVAGKQVDYFLATEHTYNVSMETAEHGNTPGGAGYPG